MIGVTRVDADIVHEELTNNVLSADVPSEASRNVLGQHNLLEQLDEDERTAWLQLHKVYTQGGGGWREAFTLSELSFLIAEGSDDRSYYLAAAVECILRLHKGGGVEKSQLSVKGNP